MWASTRTGRGRSLSNGWGSSRIGSCAWGLFRLAAAGIGTVQTTPATILDGIEVTVPLYQNLNGPQLDDAWSLFVGVRKVFTL
jgi:hypothetical protein